MANVVHVQNISTQTTEKEVRDFFSFCGKINYLTINAAESTDGTQSATVAFEKETAAKTALLLDNTQLGPSQVHVSAASSLDDPAGAKAVGGEESNEGEVAQEDKPRSRILAEYLAHGYVISDKAIESALALDQQHGISNRFYKALTDFDSKFKATEKAQAVDNKFGVSEKAAAGWAGLSSYFEKALETPSGQKVRSFYDQGNKQVMDVHTEARHLANLKAGKTNSTAAAADSSAAGVSAEKADMQAVPGTDKTKCNCGGESGKCPCVNCACAGCIKNKEDASAPAAAAPAS